MMLILNLALLATGLILPQAKVMAGYAENQRLISVTITASHVPSRGTVRAMQFVGSPTDSTARHCRSFRHIPTQEGMVL